MTHRAILFMLMSAGLALNLRAHDEAGAFFPNEVTMTARGTFDVKVTPQSPDDPAGGPFGRLFLDKRFHGNLEGVSHGQMLAAETAVTGSGAYVAFELVTGTLQGKQGSFILQHKGTMRQGSYAMDITVVPDSGTGELLGISGAMKILIKGSEHSYEFEYSLGGAASWNRSDVLEIELLRQLVEVGGKGAVVLSEQIAPTPEAGLEAGVAMARKIAACAPLSIKATLASAHQMIDPVEADALSKLGVQYAAIYRTEDFLEGRRGKQKDGRRSIKANKSSDGYCL
jgi:Protein of unknown function (DUF3224)